MTSPRTLISPQASPIGQSLHPGTLLQTLWQHRDVVRQLGSRQVEARHRGSVLGMAWTVLNPLLLLAVYTFVFSVVLKIGGETTSERIDFALMMFTGMVVLSVFTDTVSRSPYAVAGRPNYVKKVVFPLEALPAAELYASLLLSLASLLVLLIAAGVVRGGFSVTVIALPLVVPPLVLLTLGAAWFVAALSVFVRDVATSIGVVITMLFFLTPVFWEVTNLDPELQRFVWLNPLAVLVESARDCLLRDTWPNLMRLAIVYAASMLAAQLGFAWFRHSKRGLPMSSDPADDATVLHASGLGKCYHSFARPIDRLKQVLLGGRRSYFEKEFWALREVSFTLRRGEALGLIGRNGAGKSTLLQILAGTLPPTCGEATIEGRIGALLELGSGFDPEFTGRENVKLQGAILGFPAATVAAKVPEIEAFAEIGGFFDQPVRTYSSGMFVRLAFATQIMLVPEVLIVDEALAVGDAPFQIKCMNYMRKLLNDGLAIILASHDMEAVRSLCSQVLWVHAGETRMFGDPHTVTTAYMRFLFGGDEPTNEQRGQITGPRRPGAAAHGLEPATIPLPDFRNRPDLERWGNGACTITGASFHSVAAPAASGDGSYVFANGDRLRLIVEFEANTKNSGDLLCVAFTVRNIKALNIATFVTLENGHRLPAMAAHDSLRIAFEFDNVLSRGEYGIAMSVEEVHGDERRYLDFVENAFHFTVTDDRPAFAATTLPFSCTITGGHTAAASPPIRSEPQ